MNLIAGIIVVTIVTDYLLHLAADLLNLKILKNELPDSFNKFYDANRYKKSQKYLRVRTRFDWIASTFSMLVLFVFWFGKGFPFLDNWARSWNLSPVLTGLIYMGSLLFFKALLSLPFSIYSTFVIEERFGFNKTRWSTFISDIIKGLILFIILGGCLLSGILIFFEYAGAAAWWYCWIAVTFFMLFVQFIAPTWIMPIFNKFKPLEEGKIKDAILSYAAKINYPVKNIFVMDGSKRSSKSNAFFTGFGKNKRIILFDTLIERQGISELVAILAHEMGHYKKKHILKAMIVGIVQMGIMFFLFSMFITRQELFDAFYMPHKSIYSGLVFFAMLYSTMDFFMKIFMQMQSRKNEYQADRFAVKTTGDPQSLANSLKKLASDNLSNLTPHPFYVFLNYSHPPVLDRIKAILNAKI